VIIEHYHIFCAFSDKKRQQEDSGLSVATIPTLKTESVAHERRYYRKETNNSLVTRDYQHC
jgi:hypothetical protein